MLWEHYEYDRGRHDLRDRTTPLFATSDTDGDSAQSVYEFS